MGRSLAVALVLACLAAGAALGAAWPRARRAGPLLDRLVVTVLLPALVLVKVPAIPLVAASALPAAVAWGSLALAATVVAGVARWRRWERRTLGTLLLVTPLGNTSFLGFAAVTALLGEDHLPAAITFDQLGTFLGLATWGSVVAARMGTRRLPPAAVARRVALFPPFLALVATVPLRAWPPPEAVDRALAGLGSLVAPLAMVGLGLRLRPTLPRRIRGPVATCLATRLVVLPLAALALAAGAGGLDDVAWRASVLEAGTPPMVTAGLVATAAGLDEELASAAVGVGLLMSLATLPLLSLALH